MINSRTKLLGKNPIIPEVCAGPGEPGMVSVIIPTFNRGYFIGKTIDSVLSQTYRQIELIIVDDGSSDDTRTVVAQYGSQVHYIYQENAGLASARNTGLAAARGEFIAFQDSDDIWLPWKIQAQVALMRRLPELALVWTDMTAVDPEGEIVREKHLSTMYAVYQRVNIEKHLPATGKVEECWPECPPELQHVSYRHGDIFASMFLGNLVHPPAALLRRQQVFQAGGLDMTYAWTCEDYEFFWRVSEFGSGALIDASSMFYRVDAEDQLTKPHLLLFIARGNLIALQRRFREFLDGIKLPHHTIRHHMADAHEWVAIEELKSDHGSRVKAFRHLCKSISLHPFKNRAYANFVCRLLFPKTFLALLRSTKRLLSPAGISLLINSNVSRELLNPLSDFSGEIDCSIASLLAAVPDLVPYLAT
jgi:glycosyltransferase involved in cell wall biosynthesis